MNRRIWSDDVRKRLGVEDAALPQEPEPPKDHFHIWAEKGWSGTLSPRLADMAAVHEEMRLLMAELDAEIHGSASFPFTQIFLTVKVGDGKAPVSLNVTVGPCNGNRRNTPCNRGVTWR